MAEPPSAVALPEDAAGYNTYISTMRREQYSTLASQIYLDHAGMTPFSKLHMDRFHADMMGSFLGNPHSASQPSQHSAHMIDDTRLQLLRMYRADPEDFDVVFTANATAGIKLVMEAFRGQEEGFWFGYHVDSHTSLVGVREVAAEQRCFEGDEELEAWIQAGERREQESSGRAQLFAYPAQSNMNGRRLPLDWSRRLRAGRVYTLLDAAAYASTSPLDLSNAATAPDFAALSLYKIFGFPDLGALIVRKAVAHIFQNRAYFGGGTVDMVVCLKEHWHAKKTGALHEQLEDGTLPVHSILALRSGIETHAEIFGTLERVSRHTAMLAERLYAALKAATHANGSVVAEVYKHASSEYGQSATQGPVIAFNMRDSKGEWVSNTEVEKLASVKNIDLRVGGLCNPGGIASTLGLQPWEMRQNFSAGQRCGSEHDVLNGKPTGMLRVSLGAMSTLQDIQHFVSFIDEFFVDKTPITPPPTPPTSTSQWHIEALTVYPIKSCAGWQVPANISWDIRPEGLAWDREWCIVHQGTGVALSQKRYPRMALIRPELDFSAGRLRITFSEAAAAEISVPLSLDPAVFEETGSREQRTRVCGDEVRTRVYTSVVIAEYFTQALGVPCTLARFEGEAAAVRRSKLLSRDRQMSTLAGSHPLLFPNESPILTITRPSLDALNKVLELAPAKPVQSESFRANILLAQSLSDVPQPWAEDGWHSLQVGSTKVGVLGGCKRCAMVCVNQVTGERGEEPFSTLAKVRRREGRVLFGVHCALMAEGGRVRVGHAVQVKGGWG